VQQRARVMMKLLTLIQAENNWKQLQDMIVAENGKTRVDAEGDIARGLEVIEHSCAMPTLMMGEFLNASRKPSPSLERAKYRGPHLCVCQNPPTPLPHLASFGGRGVGGLSGLGPVGRPTFLPMIRDTCGNQTHNSATSANCFQK
jgi:acyl-CoA reductase-like NAD-dependent aldehyde dehydrogenase